MNLLIDKLSEKASSTSEFDKSNWLNQCQNWKKKCSVNDLINKTKNSSMFVLTSSSEVSEHMESNAVLVGIVAVILLQATIPLKHNMVNLI